MINAAKADGRIDETEARKILTKLEKGGLTREEQDFFTTEARKPMDMAGVVASAGNDPAMAAQIYAASLLAIEVDTRAEKKYLERLADELGLEPKMVSHIEHVLGV